MVYTGITSILESQIKFLLLIPSFQTLNTVDNSTIFFFISARLKLLLCPSDLLYINRLNLDLVTTRVMIEKCQALEKTNLKNSSVLIETSKFQ